jgi:signal transduction histidine kinase
VEQQQGDGDASARAAERGLAHDLRNLLTAIDGHAQLARAAVGDAHVAAADLDEVLAATSRAHQLTVAWLAGPTMPAPPIVPTPLDTLVRGFLPLLAAVVGTDVQAALQLAAPDPVAISRLRLERVLLNLCLNARDAMGGTGVITIATCARPDGWLEVSVADTGPGIDPAIVGRLLDPRGGVPAVAGGHGLGLVTSRALLEEAGGRLEVDAVPGAGTTMRAVLPPA